MGHDSVENINFFKARTGWRNWLYTLDHKRIGIMYLVAVCIAFGLGGTFALLLRLELLTPTKLLFDAKEYPCLLLSAVNSPNKSLAFGLIAEYRTSAGMIA